MVAIGYNYLGKIFGYIGNVVARCIAPELGYQKLILEYLEGLYATFDIRAEFYAMGICITIRYALIEIRNLTFWVIVQFLGYDLLSVKRKVILIPYFVNNELCRKIGRLFIGSLVELERVI